VATPKGSFVDEKQFRVFFISAAGGWRISRYERGGSLSLGLVPAVSVAQNGVPRKASIRLFSSKLVILTDIETFFFSSELNVRRDRRDLGVPPRGSGYASSQQLL